MSTNEQAVDTSNHGALLDRCQAELEQIRDTHPDWFAYFEDRDPDICSRAEMMELIDTAPTVAARQFLFGKYSLRLTISMITGRPWN